MNSKHSAAPPPTGAATSAGRQPLAESPWFWLHVFATAALTGLLLIGPKFARRQAGLERNYQARQRAALKRAGKAPETPLSTPDRRTVPLWPLQTALAAAVAGSWLVLYWTRLRPARDAGRTGAAP